ncbi:LamG-like jellyroll fold domain-containing protein [Nonomuraea sp. NPDC005983]|uniref:LamG-like jellyroll fold domain-containing protein n=1 Tax=Nonomuraea sp. NPDC005983 TaxID=3155595 RepID=UPI0033A155A4
MRTSPGPMLPRIAAAVLATAAIAASAILTPPTAPASAQSAERTDPANPRFSIAVLPDTQYFFDGDPGDTAPLDAAVRWIDRNREEENIVFTTQLGDITENGAKEEFAEADKVFRPLDLKRIPYSVLAGNHDIKASTGDDRGPSPYLDTFGPQRFRKSPAFGGASPDGYNTFHTFTAGGRQWLVLALDWKPSDATLTWAQDVIDQHPKMAVILTTHDFVSTEEQAGQAVLSGNGENIWNKLVAKKDQIFLTLNGHYWPAGRTTLKNAAGHDVHAHITNYQDRYYGGSGMIRLYRFDLARDTIDVETFSPWIMDKPARDRNPLEQREIELTDPANRFSVPIDFTERFAGFAPETQPAPRPAEAMVIPGTVAYWRFDERRPDGTAVPENTAVRDLSGRGNDLTRVTISGSGADALTFSGEHHPAQPGHGSLLFNGSKNPARGAYLRTSDSAPLNKETFERGYTIEAFMKLPADWNSSHAWMGLLSRLGAGADAGRTGSDPLEPVGTLNISDGHGAQWAVFPQRRDDISTNWSHELPTDTWVHVAVVNDGRQNVMYIDGAKVLRNPSTPAVGIATAGKPWLVGATTYDRVVEQAFYGRIGDIRIVDRPLRTEQFMTAVPRGD